MRLILDNDQTVTLQMSAGEWCDIQAFARFAQAALVYDSDTSYVGQVLQYEFTQPKDFRADPDLTAAFAGIDALRARTPTGEAQLSLSRKALYRFSIVIGLATYAEDKGDRMIDAYVPNAINPFPDIGFALTYYQRAIDDLQTALRQGKPLNIDPPGVWFGFPQT